MFYDFKVLKKNYYDFKVVLKKIEVVKLFMTSI